MGPSYYYHQAAHSTNGGRSWKMDSLNMPIQDNYAQKKFRVVQQIDSLNIVAVGDSGLIYRTTNGGLFWNAQSFTYPTGYAHNPRFVDVHFSGPMNGVAVGPAYFIVTTSDGGAHWNTVENNIALLNSCHYDGPDRIRAFKYGAGPVFTTTDGGHSWDSTGYLFDWRDTTKYRVLSNCKFYNADTMIAYGNVGIGKPITAWGGYIVRTSDGGKNWQEVFADYTGRISTILNLSQAVGSTIVASTHTNFNGYSTDFGLHWSFDSIPLYAPDGFLNSVQLLPDTSVVATSQFSFLTGLLRGTFRKLHVELVDFVVKGTHVYPNPASTVLNISSVDRSRPIRIYDMIGREIILDVLDAQGNVRIDVSHLPHGVYYVQLDHYGRLLPVGKIAIVAGE